MKKNAYNLIAALFLLYGVQLQAEKPGEPQHPTLITRSENMFEVPSIESQIASGTFIPAEDKAKEFNPKRWGANTSIPGKGLPKGNDPLWLKQAQVPKSQGRTPLLSFDAASASATPTDPTGAVGPNHFVNSWNSSFRIWDKAGNPLTAAASLATILPGTLGDPIVLYDPFADRFLITEFYSNGFDVAISKGPNPVSSGWYVYRFPTSSFPDYPKFSVWSDGYYITANKDQGSPGTSQVVFALERDKMIAGNTSAQMIGFPLTGIIISGFYSPMGFNANGPTMPPPGNAPIVYMQDDAWSGVSTDHLKIWSVNVNWTTPANSTISSPQIINTTPFDGLFDNGNFINLPQPSGSDIDALQATIMYMAQYRRFSTYNTVVFNFVVDLNGADNYAGIRWYELRQTADGAPWTIYQEGTYVQPGGHSAFCGNMCMDIYGNIGLAYTVVSTTQNPALRFTGRHASDPLGTMTIAEDVFINGTSVDPSSRYGDYAQMTIDPVDGRTFWSIGEYFSGGRKNRASTFQIAPPTLTAQFSGTPTTVCEGGTVVFTDQSLASPTSWSWSFPGGTPSSYTGQTPPAITYNTAGSYGVTLTVSDGTNSDSEVKTGYITVKSVIANFTGAPTTVVIGNSVTFTDNSSCNPSSWAWSFPGGTPSAYNGQTPPAITYSTAGTYDVSLTASKPSGSDTKTRTGYITVTPPVFNITNGSITTCTGDFYDSGGSSGVYQNNETFTETFYPSTPGSMIRFNFTSFTTELNYDTLTIYNGVNSSAPVIGKYHGSTGPGIVTASNASGALTFRFHSDGSLTYSGWTATISCYSTTLPPAADFSAYPLNPQVAQTVTFTDQSSNSPTSWTWSFSPSTVSYAGGTGPTSANPQVQFNAVGQYSVSLTASNAYGSNTKTKTNYINVTNCTIAAFPWTEGFENAGAIPPCWTQEQVNSSGINWTFITGNGAGYPSLAHSGSYNACLKDANSADNKTRLITPALNLAFLQSPQLKFWHTQTYWSPDQDQLSVFYKTSAAGTWTLLTTYTASITTWTQETISLPGGSSSYYIAFEGNAKWGRGVCIDDVEVSSSCSAFSPVGISIVASANPVCEGITVNYTATPTNGGTSPSFQWKVNGTDAGGNNAVFNHTPLPGDRVSCMITSSATCITGSPAFSDTITMVVDTLLPVSVSIVASANPVFEGIPVTFNAGPVNGGPSPAYQWRVNSNNAGSNEPAFTYVPASGDQVYCTLTSDTTCASGNPAASNVISMTVNPVPVSLPTTLTLNDLAFNYPWCFNALLTITVAGNNTTFAVQNGGVITLIAGQNILFYPGTMVESGGILNGYIAPGGPMCPPPGKGAVTTGTDQLGHIKLDSFYEIYPNPTTGGFVVELNGPDDPGAWMAEIYTMKGEKLFSMEMAGEKSHAFSLTGNPAGIYLIRVISNGNSGTTRIIKQK